MAGLHRQTWLSGLSIWVDIHISNASHKTVKKIEIHLEKVTLFYNNRGISAHGQDASRLRLPDRKETESVSVRTIKKGVDFWKGINPKSSEMRTIEVEIPKGQFSIKTGTRSIEGEHNTLRRHLHTPHRRC